MATKAKTASSAKNTEVKKKKASAPKVQEKSVVILSGTWVRLGKGKNIPEELRGHEACVTDAPIRYSDGDEQIPFRHQYQDEDAVFTVRTRDEYSATLQVTRADFDAVSLNGRIGLGSAG